MRKHAQLHGYSAKNLDLPPTVCGLWVDDLLIEEDDEAVTCAYCLGVLEGVREKVIPSAAVREGVVRCTTHHHACDCREDALQSAIERLLDELADQGIDTVGDPARELLDRERARVVDVTGEGDFAPARCEKCGRHMPCRHCE